MIKTLLIFVFLGTALVGASGFTKMKAKPQKTWAVYYGEDLPYSDFQDYNILAFDSDAYPDFLHTRRDNQVILGYLSTTEAETYRPYFEDIKANATLLTPSELWDEHIVIDIREAKWRDYFIHTLIPRTLKKGFDGIMLDTIDTVLYMEEAEPAEYQGMREAAIAFIHEIRAAHPEIKLMLNRGFPILQDVASELDYVLAESIMAQYNFEKNTAKLFPLTIYQEYVDTLKQVQQRNDDLQVVTLDYWDMTSHAQEGVKQIYKKQRSHGLIPYVTTVDLKKHHREPQ